MEVNAKHALLIYITDTITSAV